MAHPGESGRAAIRRRAGLAVLLAAVAGSVLAVAPFEARCAELTTPAIAGVVVGGAPIGIVRDDFRGTEGPMAFSDGSLLFTEAQATQVTRIGADGSVSALLTNAGVPNALALNRKGELLAVLTGQPALAVIYPAAKARTLADSFNGKPLNRPNDLVVDRRGGVYFTDPGGRVKPAEAPPSPAVYYFNPAGKLLLATSDVAVPNGIQLSPNEKTLYVADTRGEYVVAFDVGSDGSLSGRRNFAHVAVGGDGLAVDSAGRLYVATTLGVEVVGPDGAALGVITLPKQPQNLAFAGRDKRTLYVVGRGTVYQIPMLTRGFTGRAK